MPSTRKSSQCYSDSAAYLAKKAALARLTTVYGKNAVREALLNHPHPGVIRLIIADDLSEQQAQELLQLAKERAIEIVIMPRQKLSRITKNYREDQGIAADLNVRLMVPFEEWQQSAPPNAKLLALAGVTTPANIGIVVRSVAAAGIDGLVVTKAGSPVLNLPLVVKASSGCIFRTSLFGIEDVHTLLKVSHKNGWQVYSLASGKVSQSLFEHHPPHSRAIYLLGNESLGLPTEVLQNSTGILHIPLAHGVESLNVAAAATLVAYRIAM